MIDVPNSLIRPIGMLNRACTGADVSWQILKYPGEDNYTALLTPIKGEHGADVIKADYIDDLIGLMIEQAEVIARSN